MNDTNIYSLDVFNIGDQKVEKSLMDDKEVNIKAKKTRDILHKYKTDRDGVNTMRVDLRDQESQGKKTFKENIKEIKKDDQNVDIMVNFRHIQTKYQEHVNEFEKNIASIDANTAQIIEFNKQKAFNMSSTYKAMERKGQELYQSRVAPQIPQNQENNNEQSKKLRDMIYNLDVKIISSSQH